MTKVVKPVVEGNFGRSFGDSQDPDEPYDRSAGTGPDAFKIGGRGSQGGGSKPTPQAKHRRSMATSGSSAPKRAQKLRG